MKCSKSWDWPLFVSKMPYQTLWSRTLNTRNRCEKNHVPDVAAEVFALLQLGK